MSITREEISVIPARTAVPLIGSDGQTVVLQYALESGKSVNIGFDSDQASQLLHSLAALLSSSLNKQPGIGGAGFVRMTEATQARANPTDGDGLVALCLIDKMGVAHYFSLPVETSVELRSGLRGAESKARAGFRLPRA